MKLVLEYRNGRACQAARAATTRRAAASRRPRRGARSSTPRSGCSSAQGYAATTMAAIAAEAGVALKTVYVAFETKSGVLRALWHLLLRGDEDDAPVARARVVPRGARGARPGAAAAAQRAQLARGQGAGRRRARGDPPRGAADADIAALWDRIQSDFHDNQRAIVESARREGRARARARRRPRDRHPVDAQPPRRLAAARRPSAAGRPSSTSSGSPTPPAQQLLRRNHGEAPPGGASP